MACPFFMPTKRMEGGVWPHPSRLPLGAGWEGLCTAMPEAAHPPDSNDLCDHCNLGYPRCGRVPEQRHADAVRFSVAASSDAQIVLLYACELNHHPAEHGRVEYDLRAGKWSATNADSRIQRMAECYLQAHLERKARR